MADFRTVAFRYGTPKARILATLFAGSVLAGCTAPGGGGHVSKYEPTYTRMTEERVFAQALRQRYLELATHAYDRGDLDRSDFYSLRALMAVEGKLVAPADPDAFALDAGTAEEANALHAQLENSLMGGVRTGAPDLAARVQAAYDCWLLESGPDGDPAIAQSCRHNTFETMARLDAASVGAQVAHAGGHEYARPQTYVIDPGTPAQTIQANGVTIEVVHQAAPAVMAYQPAPVAYRQVPAAYTTRRVVPSSPVAYEAVEVAVPVTYEPAAPASYQTVEAAPVSYGPAPEMIETAPISYDAEMREGFDTVPIMSAEDAAMLRYDSGMDGSHAEMAMMETLPVGKPMNILPGAEMPMMKETTVDLGPIDTAPVYGGPQEIVPMVAMSETAREAGDALIAAQAAMQSDFSVYFGFDSDEITPEAEDVLVDTVERIKLSGAARVTLTGFTDSMGDARYNQLLAMRRAQAVRKYLQRKTGGEVSFEILPIGEVQAVQAGGDGVMEALNRRVEIAIQ